MTGPARKLASVPSGGPGPALRMTHAQLDQNVAGLARWLRLYAYHTRNSTGSARGFPDWVLIGPGGILYRENKVPPDTLKPDQRAYGKALTAAGANWGVWRPEDWHTDRIRREMDAIAHPVREQAALVATVSGMLAAAFSWAEDAAQLADVATLIVGICSASQVPS